MDAKSLDLALLGFLALFCAISAWAGHRDVVGLAFFALGTVAIVGAAYSSLAEMDQLILKRASASRASDEKAGAVPADSDVGASCTQGDDLSARCATQRTRRACAGSITK